jgi:hypothetical protein
MIDSQGCGIDMHGNLDLIIATDAAMKGKFIAIIRSPLYNFKDQEEK